MSQTHRNYVELDARRRTSLNKFGRKSDTRYLVREFPDGTIELTPAVVLTQREVEMLADPERMESVRLGVKEVHAGHGLPLDPVALLAELEARYPENGA